MHSPNVEHLTERARALLKHLTPDTYTRLLVRHEPVEPKKPIDELRTLSNDDLFATAVKRADEASCVLAGLFLLFDQLDLAHRLVQELSSAGGSFWHAIMHRREGDFSNSKYWYARCANHPALGSITQAASPLVKQIGLRGWSGPAMVDLVEDVADRPSDPRHAIAIELQQLEWRMLFEHCVRAAVIPSPSGRGGSLK